MRSLTLLLIPLIFLSSCTIDWNDEKDAKIAELEKQVQELNEELHSLGLKNEEMATQIEDLELEITKEIDGSKMETSRTTNRIDIIQIPKIDRNKKAIPEGIIDGDFNGWEGDTIVKLTNGQIWKQTNIYYEYYYAYRPSVTIYKDGIKTMMKVEGMNKAVQVELINL